MATTIDKYVLETSVSGMKDVDALNTSVKTLGSSIDTVTAKKISMTINIDNLSELSNTIKGIDTSLTNIAKKIVKPSVDIAALDQLNATMRLIAGSVGQLNANNVNIKVNDSEVTRAKGDVSLLNNEIDRVNGKTVSIKADNGPTSLLGQNIDELKGAFSSLSTGLLAGGVAAAIAGIVSLGTKAVETAGAITDLSEASGLSASEIYSLGDSIINAGGAAGQNYDVIDKLSMSIEDAAINGGKAAEAFKDLNVPIKDANGKMRDTGDILRDVFEALGKTEDRTKRLSTAQELLGKANRNLKFEDIKFTDDAKMNTQIANTDSLGASFDKLMQAVNKFSMATVSSGADDAAGKVGTLTEYINNLTSIFNFATEKSDTFGLSLVDLAVKAAAAVNPLMAMVDLWKKGEAAVKYLRENVWQNKSDPLMAGNADAIKSNPLGQSKGYQGRIKPFELPPPKYDDSRFGVKPPKGGGAGGGADAAAREAEARKRSREESDAQLKAMQLLQEEEQKIAIIQANRIGFSKEATAALLEQAQIEKTQTLDIAKVQAEITKEKNKGKDADKYIIDNLEKQKALIKDNAIIQSDLAKVKRDNLEIDRENSEHVKKLRNNAITELSKIADITKPTFTNSNIDAEISRLDKLKKAYTDKVDAVTSLGETLGYQSIGFSAAMETFILESNIYKDELRAQKRLVEDLIQTEKTRSESFAGGWESAMKRMTDAMTPAQLGAQAFNDLWGNIETTLSNTIATGKFEFTQFRDKVIADIALMAAKALASNLIGKILGTAVNAVLPNPAGGLNPNIGRDGGLGLKMKASGGSVSGNQPYIVGERGPELFMPGQNGTVIPNRNLTDTKPTVNNYYTYNVSAVDGQSVARFFMENKNMVAAANSAAKKERS